MPKVISKQQITPVTRKYVIAAPLIAHSAKPGQFVIVRVREGGERIPLTIADYDAKAGTVTIVVQEVGATTHMLSQIEEGGEILDMLGPLGEPAHIPAGGHTVGVGGGYGAAALTCIMREATARGDKTTLIMGARTKDLLILEDELRRACTNVEVCTDDGSKGFKGFVTERLGQLIEGQGPGRPDRVVAIGPMGMMQAVAEVTRPFDIPTFVSMDPVMVDGTGMCGGCRITVGGEQRFACVDGPMFDGHQVDFAEAVRRRKMYVKEEKLAVTCQRAHEGGE
ncbi:MAG: sulfide/dihydroorotate dehydrogenase-like FAD/NAD-binding protein [Phycisphaerales bacterium]|nr:sulfide/dihydroorotate dehydrogenase-like FAD/NAD-binding protein [Phycisphaerales bacterium]